jgi:LEA14-like dessication related protein
MSRSLVLLPVLVAAACIPKFYQPGVRLDAVRLGSVGFSGGTLYVQLVVDNPNTYELRSAALRYTIEMSDGTTGDSRWLPLASGSIEKELSVAANDSTSVELPVDFSYAGLGSALRSILQSGAIEYRLSGDMRVTQPVRRSVPFRRSGRVAVDMSRPDIE